MQKDKNPCLDCDCYDQDMGCTMSDLDRSYACPLEDTLTEFFIPMKPPTTTHQEKQVHVTNGKPIFYEPDDLKDARSKLTAYLGQHVPNKKYTGALRVVVKWLFLKTGKHKNGEWKITKPDTHNMNKLLFDVMTDLGYWTDDALVTSEIIEKFWADVPGIYIKIEEL